MKIRTTIAGLAIALLALTGCSTTPTAETPPAAPAEATPDSPKSEETPAEEKPAEEKPEGDKGKRSNPLSIGSEIMTDDWKVVINSVNLDAAAEIVEANMFNEAPEEGTSYVLVNLTITYTGDDEDGSMAFASIEFVTASGNTIASYDTMLIAPDALDSLQTLYPGASTTGNIAFAVPTEDIEKGTLAVTPQMLSDKLFVAVI